MAELQFFKDTLNSEIKSLTKLCEKWEKISANNIPDDAYGKILAVLGQSRLLLHDKLQQFRGLINLCNNDKETMKITIDDLQGFWDLVKIQIDDINKKFIGLEELQRNHWISDEVIMPISQNIPVKQHRKNSFDRNHSEAAKLRLAAAKLQIQARMNRTNKCCNGDAYYY